MWLSASDTALAGAQQPPGTRAWDAALATGEQGRGPPGVSPQDTSEPPNSPKAQSQERCHAHCQAAEKHPASCSDSVEEAHAVLAKVPAWSPELPSSPPNCYQALLQRPAGRTHLLGQGCSGLVAHLVLGLWEVENRNMKTSPL